MPDMKYTKTIALITTLLCFLQGQGLALAQDNPNQYNYLYLTIRNGLCDNSIRTIHKDHNSFMWFGTSNGLDRYDGYELKHYSTAPRQPYQAGIVGGIIWDRKAHKIKVVKMKLCRRDKGEKNFPKKSGHHYRAGTDDRVAGYISYTPVPIRRMNRQRKQKALLKKRRQKPHMRYPMKMPGRGQMTKRRKTAKKAADSDQAKTDEQGQNPGEQYLQSTEAQTVDFASEMKLNREQVRSRSNEDLLEIINNDSITEAQKQEAIDKMVELTDVAERKKRRGDPAGGQRLF